MIVTVTPNPSLDRTISVPALARGAVQKVTGDRVDAGGKGINVARALALNGTATTAVLPVGGTVGDTIVALLADAGVPVHAVRIAEAVRNNVAVVEDDGTTTKLNETGPTLTPLESGALDEAVRDLAVGATWVVGSGSLPRGLGDDYFARLVADARAAGARVAVDATGTPMTLALAAGPSLVKPNRIELAEVVGRDLPTLRDVVDAARELLARGVEEVVVSLGRDGALLVTADEVVHGIATVDTPVSTVGAGDSLLAGYLHATSAGATPRDALRTAIAFGSAAVALPGSTMPGPAQVAAVHVDITPDPDPAMPLTD